MSYFGNRRSNDLLRSFGYRRTNAPMLFGNTIVPSFAVFGTGLLIGAGVALLFAPKTGRELRSDIGRRAGQLTDNLRNAVPRGRTESEWSSPNVSSS